MDYIIQEYKKGNLSNDNIITETKSSDIISVKFKLRKGNKILFRNFNNLSKEELSQLNIIKKLSNRESYFYFLEYIINFDMIKTEQISKKDENKKTKTKKVPKLLIDFSGDQINITKSINEGNNPITEPTEDEYGEMIKKININIDEYFKIGERLTIRDLRAKIIKYLEDLTFGSKDNDYIPDFESELFFHYQLENVLETFEELKDDYFSQKIELIQNLKKIIYKVKDKKVKDKIILMYFYFVMDMEYKLDKSVIRNLNDYEEENFSYNNIIKLDTINNKLIINNEKIIDNFDYYKIKQEDIQQIILNKIKLPLNDTYYSFKGDLIMRDLTYKDGYIIYEKFIGSPLYEDIFFSLYEIKNNLLNPNILLEYLKKNTYYFEIQNSTSNAYSDKKCFNIFVDYSVEERIYNDYNFDYEFMNFIKKAFMTVNTQHEFGHSHQRLLVFLGFKINNSNNFDSPLVNIKLKKDKNIQITEGGDLFEYLLYGRVIKEMNLKEIIYINNINNFQKSLNKFHYDFVNLKNKNVEEVFKTEGKNNNEISKIYNLYNNLTKEEKEKLENDYIKSAKRRNDEKKKFIDFENFLFRQKKVAKPHTKGRRRQMEIEDE